MDELKDIDYLVMRANMIEDDKYIEMVNKFINHEHVSDPYIGFFLTKTIYRVK